MMATAKKAAPRKRAVRRSRKAVEEPIPASTASADRSAVVTKEEPVAKSKKDEGSSLVDNLAALDAAIAAEIEDHPDMEKVHLRNIRSAIASLADGSRTLNQLERPDADDPNAGERGSHSFRTASDEELAEAAKKAGD